MFYYGSKPTNNIKEDIQNVDQLINNLKQLPKPIISCDKYYDCFEISMLRFIHIIVGRNNSISLNKLKYLIGDSYNDNKLYNFFSIYNKYNNNLNLEEKLNWCNMLRSLEIFHYKYDNSYKINPTVDNLFIFLQFFFPNLNRLAGNKLRKGLLFLLVNDNFNIKIYKNGTIYQDKIYEEYTIKIYIDNNNIYDWHFYQYYENLCDEKGKFITGYTEINYSKYILNMFKNN